MVCEHLEQLDKELQHSKIEERFRGKAWSENSREWVYYNCYLDREAIRKRLHFDECVKDHEHLGTHSGSESGLYWENVRMP